MADFARGTRFLIRENLSLKFEIHGMPLVVGSCLEIHFFPELAPRAFPQERERVVALARAHSVRNFLGTSLLSIDIEIHKFYLVDRVPFGMMRLWMGNSGYVLFNTSRALE